VTAVDWEPVLAVARENALRARVADRYRLLPGDALTLDLAGEYQLVLVMNFLHHFDAATCLRVLRKLHDVMADGGGLALLELVPAPDRVSPPLPAAFGLTMLACTPGGDVYSRAELQAFLDEAGFHDVSFHPVTMAQTAVLARR
jgi:ubiquinone/menaquinone biosynthesis C-methylase UbiE